MEREEDETPPSRKENGDQEDDVVEEGVEEEEEEEGEDAPEDSPLPAEGAGGAAPAAEKKKRGGPRGKRQIAIPKDSASFFRARKRDVKAFTFTSEGDLQVPEMRGQPAKVIPLPSYRPATIAELKEVEEARKESLAGVELEIDELQKELKEAIAEWRRSGATANVLRIQRELAGLDAKRTAQITPIRWTANAKGLSLKQVFSDEAVGDRKLGFVVFMLRTRPYLFTESVRERVPGEVEALEEAAEGSGEAAVEREPESFVFFFEADDPEHGKVSPDTMVEFVYNETKYTSPIQAYEIERVSALGRKEVRKVLLRTTAPKKLRALSGMIKGNVEDPRALWIGILTAVVNQHPEIGEVLRSTGKDTLVFADPRDEVSGIGLSVEDENVTERSAWKGQNLLGQAWMAVREGLAPEGEELSSQSGGGYVEHGMTLRERQEERGNVLIGMAKRKGAY